MVEYDRDNIFVIMELEPNFDPIRTSRSFIWNKVFEVVKKSLFIKCMIDVLKKKITVKVKNREHFDFDKLIV